MTVAEIIKEILKNKSPFVGKLDENICFDINNFMDLVENPILRSEQVRCAIKGKKVDESKYIYSVSLGRTNISNSVSPAKISQLLFNGATVTIDSLEYLLPEVMKVCKEVENVTGMRCTATAYFTGPGEKGLLPHIDEEEVVMVQVAGAKKWVYSNTVYDHLAIPRAIDVKELSSVKVNEYNLESGNFLALPSGTIHAGETEDNYSIHITFSVEKDRNAEKISKLIDSSNKLIFKDVKFLNRNEISTKELLEEYISSLQEVDFSSIVNCAENCIPSVRGWFFISNKKAAIKFSNTCEIKRGSDGIIFRGSGGSIKLGTDLGCDIENFVRSGKVQIEDKKILYILMKMLSINVLEVKDA